MEQSFFSGRAVRDFFTWGLFFFLVLGVAALFGCASVEKPQPVAPFLMERSLGARRAGEAAYDAGDYLEALVRFREARDIDARAGDEGGRIRDLIGMGRAYTGLGRVNEAVRTLTDAVRLSFSSRDTRGLAGAYEALAGAYLRAGEYGPAVKNIDDALALEKSGDGYEPRTLNLAGRIYLEAGRPEEAGSLLEIATKEGDPSRPSPGLADSYRLMARVLARRGESTGAMEFFKKAYDTDLSLGRKAKTALDLRGLAGILSGDGRYEEAASRLKESLSLDTEDGDRAAMAGDLERLVEVYRAMGDKRSARYYRAMKEAVITDMR